MSAHLLTDPSDQQIEQIVDVCIRAYSGDNVIRSMTGDRPELWPPLFRAWLKAGRLAGAIYVVESEPGRIASAGLWFGPGKALLASEEQRALGWNEFWEALTPETHEWWAYLNKTTAGMADEKRTKEIMDGWFANMIATDPAFQRRGYASSIVRAVCERGVKEGTLVALGTQKKDNVAYYRSLGFEVFGQTDVLSKIGDFTAYLLSYTPP
ncbi:hypothetical protein HGRIS_006061 [Hohenbuehelia grisea]|uniref:N-acetyltransferase domain-containing protein n=1 Tax=Hohenbuehelia grisea TaxID=104357 RepID=A0ABR3K194_9AGAR